MATIQDVARMAQVSSATVSRVLNGSQAVKPETRNAVIQAMQGLNYEPNHFSQNLRRQQSHMILVLLPSFSNPYYGEILDGMDEESRLCGYSLLQFSTYSEALREHEAISLLESRQAAGAIFMAPCLTIEEMERLNDRFFIVQCCEYVDSDKIAHVSINNYEAAYAGIEHLMRLGHHRIGMISSANGYISTSMREKAYHDVLRDNGIEYDESLLLRGNYSFESGVSNTQRLLNMEKRPTAIAAISDTVAAGAINRIQSMGLKIPADVAVMGFDNIYLARMTSPPLSTVSQPLRELGRTAIQMIVGKIEGRSIQDEVFLPFEILLRKSTL